ncbi:choice-of-anchor L domain-containing protein, partial [uncultured Psychroserpens sp.]
MKKLYVLFILLSYISFGQDLNMQDGTFNRCAPDLFFDSGGPGGPYSSDEALVTTICPENAGEFVIINFTDFSTQLNVDVLTVYDGDSTAAPVIGTYSGVAGPGNIVASLLNMSGCITFEFVSDGAGTTTGWEAEIICTVPCQTITPSIDSTTPEANGGGVILINAGDQVDFVGSATFSDDGTGATYEWDFDDTNTATGTNVSNIFAAPGSYDVTLTVTDNNPLGCSVSRDINVFVLGENIVVDQTTFTVEELVQDVLIDSPCAQVSNITWSTGTNFNDDNGIGYFANDGSVFPFTDGLILTSGDASRARGPNNNALSDGGGGWPGDAELDAAVGINSNNASIIQFDFVPLADSISFDFLMASEEYNGSTGGTFECTFSDAFAFLLTDQATGITTNLAVLPGTNTPILVTNIHPANPGCPAINEQFFGGYTGNNSPPMSFDGRTAVFTAQSPVTPGNNYTIKLVIADASDTALDSGVFIEAGSFNLGGDLGDDITIAAGTAECGGETITLDTQAPTATHIWYKDAVEIVGETSSTLDVTEPGIYTVDVIFSGSCQASDSVVVEFKANAEANTPPDLSICSFSGTGDFMLTDNDDDVLGTQDPNDYVITYHLTEQEAIDNVNPIPSPYTNVSNPQTIHVRIAENTQECFDLTSFDLVFTDLTINNTVTPIDECDDDNDGFTMFTLTERDDEVIGALDATTVTVTYHFSQDDANNDVNPLPIPYTNVVPDNQIVYVRVEANIDAGCFNTTTLELRVNSTPVPIVPTTFEVCDDNNDGFAMFDLTTKDAEIIGLQTGVTVTYHESQAEADDGSNAQPSPYTNIDPNTQTLYVRLEDDISGCFDTVELVLLVNPIPDVGAISNYELCDYNLPGDEVEVFDLTTKAAEAINGQTGVTISYHESQIDAEGGANPILNASFYSNTSTPQTIYVNITNTSTGCSNVGSFDLIVNPLPALVNPTPLEVCDDGVPDGLTSIDLTLKNTEITDNNANYSVSYHLTQADADGNVNPLPIPYTNISNCQTVFVRVQDINTG